MTPRVEIEKEFFGEDETGNRIYKRTLPDGSVSEVIKNFPSKNDLLSTLKEFSNEVDYFEFKPLERWMVVYRVNKSQ